MPVAKTPARPHSANVPRDAGLEARTRPLLRRAHIPGAGLACIRAGSVVSTVGIGQADAGTGVPVTPRSVFPVASVSKALIPLILLKLVEAGRVDLDADVSRYVGFAVRNPHRPQHVITLRHLLTHTSGILDGPALGAVERRGDPTVSSGVFLRDYLEPRGKYFDPECFARRVPGADCVYSNVGAGLAAHVAERVSGLPFRELVQRELFAPLGITDAGYRRRDVSRSRLVRGYAWLHGALVPQPLTSWPIDAVGELKISTASLALLCADLAAGLRSDTSKLLRRASLRQMVRLRGSRAWGALGAGQALGWMAVVIGGRRYVGHAGAMAGASAAFFLDPHSGDGAVVATNGSPVYLGTPGQRAAFFALLEETLAAATPTPRRRSA